MSAPPAAAPKKPAVKKAAVSGKERAAQKKREQEALVCVSSGIDVGIRITRCMVVFHRGYLLFTYLVLYT